MNNMVFLRSTTFVTLEGGTYYGYLLSDDHASTYNTLLANMVKDDMDLLRVTVMYNDIDDYLEVIRDRGIIINGNHYTFETVESILLEESYEDSESLGVNPRE